MTDPHLNSIWRFLGAPGGGELHRVIEVDEDSVVSMSPNFIWYGFKEQFLAVFKFVQFGSKK